MNGLNKNLDNMIEKSDERILYTGTSNLILKQLIESDELKFGEIYRGIFGNRFGSPAMLTGRLRELQKYGLINRREAETPEGKKIYFSITEDGKKVSRLFGELEQAIEVARSKAKEARNKVQ